MYTGLMYNDVFSKTLYIWRSGWDWVGSDGSFDGVFNGHIYPFGLDPAWREADNSLVFTNSYKMKMSIVLGVIHVGTFYFSIQGDADAIDLDDFRSMSASSQSSPVQQNFRHLHHVHPFNDLPPVDFRVPRYLHYL